MSNGYAEGDDAEGDDYISADEANVLGAIFRRGRGRRPPPRRQRPRRIPSPQLRQQPTWKDSRLRSYLGMGFTTWPATDATDKQLPIEPQESFEGRRLIVDTIAAGGTSAGLNVVRRIDVGTMPQSPSVEQPGPAAMFRADATYSYLDLQIAYRATRLILTLGITAAPGVGVTVTASAGFFGNWIR
jgi:hypothetical protein